MSPSPAEELPSIAVASAMRLSYYQAMLGAVYAASTGGMFLIGYALKLGADDVQIGLLSTVPMLCVVGQLLASVLVEGGYSRKRLSILGSLANVSAWALVILIPLFAARLGASQRIEMLIAVITAVALFGNLAGNARASWVGDLVPHQQRGHFFGMLARYGAIVGVLFTILEGLFLDQIKSMGLAAFSILFAFGMLFGLFNAALFVPQPDRPLPRRPGEDAQVSAHLSAVLRRVFREARATFTNLPLLLLMAYALLWQLQALAWPFYATYMLRDLGMSFLGVGLVNVPVTICALMVSPFWGRVVDRYGCRPVLIACTLVVVPIPWSWLWFTTARSVYIGVPILNLIGGVATAGIGVAINTLLYKLTPAPGRSVQLAIYSAAVVVATAPLPTLGGHLPHWLRQIEWLNRLGLANDLRCTFYCCSFFVLAAAIAARFLREPGSRHTHQLMRDLPLRLLAITGLRRAA